MKKNVLIIEDNQADFEKIRSVLFKYNIGVFPSSDIEFKSLAKLLREFGEHKSDELLHHIKQKILNYNFDFIILDLSFTSRLDDRSGLDVEEKLFKIQFPDKEICYISNSQLNSDNYIDKNDIVTLENNLYDKVIKKVLDTDVRPHSKEDEVNKNILIEPLENNVSKIVSKLSENTSIPKMLSALAAKEKFKFRPTISFLVDSFIKYLFYIIIFLLFIYAPIYIFWSLYEYRYNPIQIAEQTFIVFLPFLITCGFFVFYIKSLSPYIKQKAIDKDDFESSSDLMKLTKKLFVSSLLSYLFIKLIELLALEESTPHKPTFQDIYKTDIPLIQLYFVIGFILILLLYYIYIDRHHNNQ